MQTDFESSRVPLPYVLGGVGFLLGILVPGGISGGIGFVTGFLVGVVVILISAAKRRNKTEG